MTKVHCTVDNCEYWKEDNFCKASEIFIAGPGIRPNEEIDHHGRGIERHAHTPTDRKDGTFCYTFEPNGHRR